MIRCNSTEEQTQSSKMNTYLQVLIMQIKHDFTIGTLYQWKKYIPSVLIFLCICLECYMKAQGNALAENKATYADYLIYAFRGMEVYIPSPDKKFEIPVIWLSMNLYVAFLIGDYPLKDILGFGQQILIRSNHRGQWWFSKCIWNLCSVLLFYFIGNLVIFLFALAFCGGTVSMTPTEVVSMTANIDINRLTDHKWILFVFVIPFLTSITLSLVQMTLEFVTKPIFSYAIVVCILILSGYFFTPFLIGNNSMLLRSEIVLQNGIPLIAAVLFAIFLIGFTVLAGYLIFKRYDVLAKKS